jgi:DNA repair photolyase
MNEIGITERGDAALDLGWVPWVKAGKPAILITKDPQLLLGILGGGVYSPKTNIIVHCTITGFGGTVLEPNVSSYDVSLGAYNSLIKMLGSCRVILRIDPVIPTLKGRQVAMKVLKGRAFDTRVRISFIDNYNHVKRRFKTAGVSLPWDSFHAPLEDRISTWKYLGEPEICGEPGFKCTGCVSAKDCETLDIDPSTSEKGQRAYCACLANKHELLSRRSRCPHKCLYCYWSDS